MNLRGRLGRGLPGLFVLLGLGIAAGQGLVERSGAVPEAKQALEPLAPELPGGVADALQAGKYDEAIAALDPFAADPKTKPADRAFAALVGGIARQLAGRLDDARKVLATALDAAPDGPWAGKLRAQLAVVELAAGRFAQAEALARTQALALLADGRKDRLAGVYQAFARRLLDPDAPTAAADPEGAHALFEQARNLAKGGDLRAELLLAMARASQRANNHPRALQELQQFLDEYPEDDHRAEARYRLGESQLQTGQAVAARGTWSDLARDLQKVDTRDAQRFRADALYQIALTHGIPNPPDDAQLGLGVAALRRFLAAYPTDPKSVTAAYQIAQSYITRGRSQEALAAFRAFIAGEGFEASTDEARKGLAELRMAAQFQIGQTLQAQGRFDDAIAAYKEYLAKFPNGPASADAQRAILDTRLLIAQELLRQEKYDDARDAWRAFAAEHPLDPRVPQVLFQIGESFVPQEKYDDAIAAWETLIGKFPGTEPAGHAQFLIASIYENEKGKPEEAIERFKKVAVEPWASSARQRIAAMEAKALTVVTPRTFRSGETPQLKITTRNLPRLTFTAYRIDPEAYFRKKNGLGGVESLDIGLVAPDAEWTADVPGYAKYRPIETTYDLKVKVPGVYVVKVTDEKHLQATTLVLGSDLDVIVKASREQLLVFAQDMKTGKGRPGARVLLVGDDGGVIPPTAINPPPPQPPTEVPAVLPCAPGDADPAEAQAIPVPPIPAPARPEVVRSDDTTGKDGVLLKTWDKPRDPNTPLHYLVIDGDDVAGSDLGIPAKVAQGLSARAYLYTDRPAYRPGQAVELRGVVREVEAGQYANRPGAAYRLEVTDSRGRPFVARAVTLSPFGTFHESIRVDDGAPVGTYRVRLYQPGKSEFAGQFEVQAYKLEKVELTIDLPKTVYFRGETIEGKLVARYQYGTPLANRPVAVQLPDGRRLEGTTDADGHFPFTVETAGFAEEQALSVVGQLPQENVAAAATVMLAVRAFSIRLSTTRDVYLAGEPFRVEVATRDAQGEPTGQTLDVRLLKVVNAAGRTAEREVATEKVTTDPKTGDGSVTLTVADDEEGGSYIVRAAGTDRFGNPVVADRSLLISGSKDETRLRFLADRTAYKVGEPASVRLHSRAAAGPALLTWEADRILAYKVVNLKEGENAIDWEVTGPEFPNFTLAAARMAKQRFDEARLDLEVRRDLRVTVRPLKDAVGPGESVEVEVTTRDQLDRPVAAEVSLALVDEALLRLFGDNTPPIGPFFYDQTRTGAFAAQATNTFAYHPATVPVPQAIVEAGEQEAARKAALVDRVQVMERAKDVVLFSDGARNAGGAPAPAGPMSTVGGLPAESAPEPEDAGPLAKDKQLAESMGRRRPAGRGGAAAGRDTYAFDAKRADTAGKTEGLGVDFNAGLRLSFGLGDQAAGPRESFVETAYWNPAVVTGADGKARVTLKAPTALSRYRFTARGVTGADTLAGQTTAELRVKKDVFVDLKVPTILTEGDTPRFSARLHHTGVNGEATLRLAVYAGGREAVYPATVQVKGDGVDEVQFDPFEIPAGDVVRLELTATIGKASDTLVAEVPIRAWGIQALASASGTSSDDTTAFVELPGGRAYEDPEMVLVLSPTLRRMLVELAVGPDAYTLPVSVVRDRESISFAFRICFPQPPDTLADRASELLGAAAVLGYLRNVGGADAPEAARLADRIRGLAAELIQRQNDDGGWPWVGGGSDRAVTARATWALAAAEPLGLLPNPQALDKAADYLTQELAKVPAADHDGRAAILHALSTRRRVGFEQANSLNRSRQDLSDIALAYLALTFAELQRPELAGEVLDVLAPRAKTEATGPGLPARNYWEGGTPHPFHRGPAEATGLAAFAFARVRPDAPALEGAVAWLLAHRVGHGWQPTKAKGPALAALSAYYARGQAAEDRYHLVVTVNDAKVFDADVNGRAEGQAIRVPNRVLKAGGRNRIAFDIEGRGTFGYAATLTGFTREFGPDQDRANRRFLVERRVYMPADPEFQGKPLPTGFGVAVNAEPFRNTAAQVALGGRVKVQVEATRIIPAGQPDWERDFLILEEYLPAGTTLVEGSLQTTAAHHTLADGVLTLYFPPDQWPQCHYEVFGYLPGQYRALPARLRSAYEPGRVHLGKPDSLEVLPPGRKPTDPYKPTPDELYARGKALFDAGRLAEAAEPLEALWSAYTLRDDVARDAARMLLKVHIKDYNPRKVVQYFEILKERAPDLLIPFEEIKVVGRAYADINEHERAYLVWRATAEASYLEDARVGEVLRQRGKTLEAVAFLLDLWREYPGTASIEADFFGLSQLLGSLAGKAIDDPAIRRELAEVDASRSTLLLQEIRLIRTFLALEPKNPLADEASLALVNGFLALDDFDSVVKLARRYASLYPKSTFLDSYLYAEALGRFHLGEYDRAVEVAEQIARATYKDANGVDQPSPNKWEAIYILGQIYDARRDPKQAVAHYKQVADRFTDAAEAVQDLTRKELRLPEVTMIRPPAVPRVAGGGGLRSMPVDGAAKEAEKVELEYRNIGEAEVKVYPVDLLRLYLARRNLDGIAGIDLAGITPLFETRVRLDDGPDYDDHMKVLDLPLEKEGAYLVMVRGDNQYASGIALVTPLELEVREEAAAGRVRVRVRDARTKAPLSGVQIKVIGTGNGQFLGGETDLRGVYVAEGVRGQVTAVARRGERQYAFYRGKDVVGNVPVPGGSAGAGPPADSPARSPSLEGNLKQQNEAGQLRQLQRLEERYNAPPSQGVKVEGVK